ncbi:MAG: hypothetical protein EOO90_03390 [Pedobacter sp.]|nr:MAG: hypothetical protein EOO90_03390 [Pedobacter sp.]
MEYTSVSRQVNATFERASRTGRFVKQQKQKRTERFDRYAFLKQVFQPVVETGEGTLNESEKIELGFYNSARHLCDLYGWEHLVPNCKPFPFNLACDIKTLRQRLKMSDENLDLRILQDEMHPARLATIKTCNSGSVLFYLPVKPMLDLLEKSETQVVGELILSVYAYLFQIVGVNHFASDFSYLADQYAMIAEWYMYDEGYSENEEERAEHLAFFEEVNERGKVSLMLMEEKCHLEKFPMRMKTFIANTPEQWEFEKTARAFLKLYEDYPNWAIGDRIIRPFGTDEDEHSIILEQYLHFYWDWTQLVQQQFMDCINAELNECGAMDEPTTFQYFDTPQPINTHDHDFETRLFALLHELIDNLIDLSK